SIEQAAREAAEKRFRPVLMTTLVATLGLLPAALSNGIGAQTQKPLAIVVIGGALIPAVLPPGVRPPPPPVAAPALPQRQHRGGRPGGRGTAAAGVGAPAPHPCGTPRLSTTTTWRRDAARLAMACPWQGPSRRFWSPTGARSRGG